MKQEEKVDLLREAQVVVAVALAIQGEVLKEVSYSNIFMLCIQRSAYTSW